MEEFINKIIQINCTDGLKKLPEESVNCCITSPPYWNLRDYNIEKSKWPPITYSMHGLSIDIPQWEGQLGLEPDPKMFIGHLIYIFRYIKKILSKDGTLWINIGDSYARNGGSKNSNDGFNKKHRKRNNKSPNGIKPKDLIGIPWMLAFALRDDGWFLRQDIIWHKPNPMPESVKDRCTKAHEYIFLLSKSKEYYFDQESIKEPASNNTHARVSRVKLHHKSYPDAKKNGINARKSEGIKSGMIKNNESFNKALINVVEKRNKRSVWTILPEKSSEKHFSMFPQKLIAPCIQAGCPENGIVLDPFMGTGTTAITAKKINRNYIGFEMNKLSIEIADRRMNNEFGLFK